MYTCGIGDFLIEIGDIKIPWYWYQGIFIN